MTLSWTFWIVVWCQMGAAFITATGAILQGINDWIGKINVRTIANAKGWILMSIFES